MVRWCENRGHDPGGIMALDQCWRLARLWYRGRMDVDWERPGIDRMEEIFEEVGLTGPFWSLR